MNPNSGGDVVDEDAAVLQFPKGLEQRDKEKNFTIGRQCFICKIELDEPYIRCAECKGVYICPPCFARGAEAGLHQNDHAYAVMQNEFPLFDENWLACDEVKLLDAIINCGYGNWEDVSRSLAPHTAEDCQSHYIDTYIENRPTPELPKFKESLLSYYTPPIFMFQTEDVDDPPRFAPDSAAHNSMAGYNAARGEFETEHDNDAELALGEVSVCLRSDPDYDVLSALQVAIVGGYNQQLAERERRHRVVRRHGLISMHKTMSWLHRFEMTLTRSVPERLSFLMQIMSGEEFDLLFEGLHALKETERLFANLHDFRSNGLKTVRSGQLYMRLKAYREEQNKLRKVLPTTPAMAWRTTTTPQVGTVRRSAGPLDIFGLPGYDRLSPEEQKLCRTVRIVPESYLEFKHLLQSESKRHGNLKLAHARSLIKIDVNKTRKLYDFLVKEGYINQSLRVTKEFDANQSQHTTEKISSLLNEDCS